MRQSKISFMVWACVAGFALAAYAANTPSITLLTGKKTGTYYAFGKDILGHTKAKELKLSIKESDGSVENIKQISAHGQDYVGIVQSDVMGFLSRSHNAELQNITAHLRVVFPFYQEEVHVLARKPIETFKELQGKRVAIGEDGSGHMLTAVNLFAIEQIIPASIEKTPPEEALVKVLKGELDAMVFVGGKPIKIFKNLEDLTKPENQKFSLLLQQVHFLPLNNPKFYEEYEPSELIPGDYSFIKKSIPTIGVQAVLVSSDNGSKDKKHCDAIKALSNLIRNSLPKLAETGHPKWKQAQLDDNVAGWKNDSCRSQ